jgi:CMP-N-acetylneuraminic acid synthetase
MRTVALVPIRLNSKRVAGKNTKLLGGRPLLVWLLETLVKVGNIDEVCVFCSSPEVEALCPKGVRFLRRGTDLDRDDTLGEEIYDAFVKQVDADVYVLAHATSPFLKAATIENAIDRVLHGRHDSAFSAEKIRTFAWYGGKPLNYSLDHIPRTQDLEPVWVETSAFYIFRKQVWTALRQRIGSTPYIAEVDRIEGVDIDMPEDFALAEKILPLI